MIDWTKNQNLVKHMLAVEAEMRSLAKHFSENEDDWGLAGLIHDADYEKWPEEHPLHLIEHLESIEAEDWLINAVKAHAWGRHDLPEPQTKMEWALYTCDDLSGLIIACALVQPEKKLATVTLDSIKKKWRKKEFAAGVHREQIELCEEKLGIKLDDYLTICLQSIQGIAADLGL